MSDARTDAQPTPQANAAPLRRGTRTSRTLVAAAAVVLILSIVTAVLGRLSVILERPGGSTLAMLADVCKSLGVGFALAGILLGMAAALRMLRQIRSALVRLERFEYEARSGAPGQTSTTGSSAPAIDSETSKSPATLHLQEMVLTLRDIRDNTLLSEDERRDKKRRVAADEIRNAQQLVQSLIQSGDFNHARQVADDICRKYPDSPGASQLVGEIERTRERRESSDIRETGKQVNDLISISAWDRARSLARQLVERHPDAAEARQIAERSERAYQVFRAEQRKRMYAEIQRYVSRRRWREALAAARTFIERFPQSDETVALNVQVQTLEDNAEIEVRQELEAEITDMARHGRYIEAAELARKVIERYPTSPQAEVLRQQLPRLEELANDPKAPPARVRID